MAVKPSPDTIEAWTGLVRCEQALLDTVERCLKDAGFPPLAWYDVLYYLDQAPNGKLLQSAVQETMLVAQYNLCRLVDRLEREQLVERETCPNDARNNVLVITQRGRALRKAMWPAYAAAIQANVGARLTAAETRQLAGLLKKLLATAAE